MVSQVAPRAASTAFSPMEIIEQAKKAFYADDNVIGVGIGPRRVNKKIHHNKTALLIFVHQKLPLNKIDKNKVIPDEFMGMKTDVIEAFSADAPKTAADYQKDHYHSHDMSSIDWARVHELAVKNQAAPPIVNHAINVQDFGDICVIEDDGTVVKVNPQGIPYVDYVRGYQLFRTTHGDDYDFVTFFTDTDNGMPPQGGSSFWSGIYNDVTGIGLPIFSNRATWGSNRLQGFHFMNQGHFPLWRYVMGQEFGHQFGVFARYKDPITNATMTDHFLGGNSGHWDLIFDDDKSPMDYDMNNWIELPNGQFQKVNLTDAERTYCNMDLYFMGLLGAHEVGEFTLLRNPIPVGGANFTATPVRLNVNNFIAQEGTRSPNVFSAPKYWRHAFIVLTKNIHKANTLTDKIDFLRMRWEADFPQLTKGLGLIDTVLGSKSGRITPNQIDQLVGGGRTGLHQHVVGASQLQVVNTQFVGTLNAGQTARWFTFGWPTNWFVQWSLCPTTVSGKIQWSVEIERAGGSFTYWLTVTNTGTITTNFEGKYAILGV